MQNRPYFLLCSWMLFIHSLCYAQPSGTIKGKVIDNNGKRLEYASIYLSTKVDTAKVVSGNITDSLGHFSINNIPIGDYWLQIKMIGFSRHIQYVALTTTIPHVEMPPITLTPLSNYLGDVIVTAFGNMVRKTEEGIVLNASENITQIGGNATELLKNMPGIMVGAEGEISLRGKSPMILLNGRVSGISGTDRAINLEQIPASSIERIEIITIPSLKYDADAGRHH